jgi:hypothetical protein
MSALLHTHSIMSAMPISNESLYQELTDLGWHPEEDRMVHPSDPEINIWRNPYSGEVLLSPRLVEHIKLLAPIINLLQTLESPS